MKVELLPLQIHGDERGSLVSLERDTNIPFEIRRVYYIVNTKKGVTRGYHAHKELKQVAIALKGSCEFLLDDGKERVKIFLNNPSQGLLIDSCIWREISNFSEDCVLLILASHEYDESDYIRDYNYFIDVMKK
ncbi:sugar 3,4-ketoisomerase [Pantoea stewartii]|uniref:dTDP-6-deoxy-3,4-keto-hexulose isomerase n=1 Tax=Pantoea stewartii subsp. stewartii DC283 TaxID=660596 RepID=A0ABN4Z1B0_PANSE|nr:FdtA/QdtA family cupin domain-containing protein [Pantoea stewartii]ARF50685.1 dTDP-6-deoxy-3,4-keto-hexulose isomerase [Pantoea stewartii subsp. stewartii DC283]KAB0547439.1 WxcM-like domain-containing protein [Pantoea stewartii subsp. stewartii]